MKKKSLLALSLVVFIVSFVAIWSRILLLAQFNYLNPSGILRFVLAPVVCAFISASISVWVGVATDEQRTRTQGVTVFTLCAIAIMIYGNVL